MSKAFYLWYYAIDSQLILSVAYKNINPYKLSNKEIFFLFLSEFLAGILFKSNVRVLTACIYFLPVFFIYRKSHNLLKSIVLALVVNIFIVLIDCSLGFIATKVLKLDIEIGNMTLIMVCFLTLVIVAILSYFIGKVIDKYKENIEEILRSRYSLLIYVSIIVTFFLYYMNINWNANHDPGYLTKVNSFVFIMYGVILLFTCFTAFASAKKERDLKDKQVLLEQLHEYTSNLEELYTDMRRFRHDYINIITSMAEYIDDNDMEGLKKYFYNDIYPMNKKINNNNFKLGLLRNLEVPAIKGMVSAKIIRAQELGINAIIDIAEPINNINIELVDIVRVLGIILDNAVEAALESDDKKINLAFVKKDKSVVIVAKNTFKGELPPISTLYKEGVSTKGENRGLGLSNLRNILNNYKNISLDTYIEDNNFIQEIIIGEVK